MLLNELSEAIGTGTSRKKYCYFLWKNKLKNRYADYSLLTKEEFINKYCEGSNVQFEFLKQWEKSEQYQYFLNLMLFEQLGNDFKEIYDIVIEKAKQGDDKAIKTFLILKDEVSKSVKQNKKKPKQKEENEEDGLVLE